MILPNQFNNLATGTMQVPKISITGNASFLSTDPSLLKFHDLFVKNMGPGVKHFCASIPWVTEELCRMGVALAKLANIQKKNSNEPFTFYEMAAFDGAYGRTLAEHSNGLIRTLSNSPTALNEPHFNRLSHHNYSNFHVGSFEDITFDFLSSQKNLYLFKNGFDFIYEKAAFQFYSKDRVNQIGHVSKLLKEKGLMIFLEKITHKDLDEYQRREIIKDKQYKSLYFSEEDIEWKRSKMLKDMEKYGQVNFKTLVNAIGKHFKFVYLVWNSTNFYEFIASNDKLTIEEFLSLLKAPYIPAAFCFENPVTRRIFG